MILDNCILPDKTYFWFIADYDLESYDFLNDNINGVVVGKTIKKRMLQFITMMSNPKIIGLINKLILPI